MGIVDHPAVVHHDDESDDGAFSLHDEQTTRNRLMHGSILFNPFTYWIKIMLYTKSIILSYGGYCVLFFYFFWGVRTKKVVIDALEIWYSSKMYRNVPSVAALPIIKPALGGQRSISDKAKLAMQGYLNHFFGNLDIVNSREVSVKFS